MKFLSIVFFFITISCFSQTIDYEGGKFLLFNLKYPSDTLTVDGIDWAKEKTISEFTLKGTISLEYSVQIENDTTALLSLKKNDKWVLQEKIFISDWALSRIDTDKIISQFKITDFNKDGNEDLLLWANTNINGNAWTNIWLNDPYTQSLKLLYNTAENSDIWGAPEYYPDTKIISCTQVSGNYGRHYESTYILKDRIAIPLEKDETDNTKLNNITGKGGVQRLYKGKNGKWKLVKSEKIK